MKQGALLLALVLAMSGCGSITREPRNLQLHKRELVAYVESGQYDRELSTVARLASVWLEQRVARGGGKLTVVFDLDESLLRNWTQIRGDDFGLVMSRWNAWVDAARAPAIEPVREVYRLARRLGVEVIFITGRREDQRAATMRNLRAVDLADYAALLCKPDDEKRASRIYKTEARQRLTEEGHTIIANIGDQESDLAGGYAERTFKLPNPFYLTE